MAAVVFGAVLGGTTCAGAEARRRPNIVFILADDLGWAELGCYGNRFHDTLHLDRLAAEGLLCTAAYTAAPVCSPTRASLLAGQWPARVGITDFLRPDDPKHLPAECVTLAEVLRAAGYATGIIGKWHLTGYERHGTKEIPPAAQGFDEVLVSENRGIAGGSYWFPYHFNQELAQRLPGREYLIDRMNHEAIEFIERPRDRPFFLFLSHYGVHTALAGRPELVAKYEAKPEAGHGPRAPHNNPHLAAQVESIDAGVGLIVETLRRLGLQDDTLIVFTSDNGGETTVTSNAPLRGGKSMLYEGGIRVPLIMHWPGRIPAGRVCETPVSSVDFYPTFCELAGATPDPRQPLDGVSLVPLWEPSASERPDRPLYWHYPLREPHFLGGRSGGAIRVGDWKLIEWHDTNSVELYDLGVDLGEEHDLAAAEPGQTERLKQALAAWRGEVNAEGPQPPQPFQPPAPAVLNPPGPPQGVPEKLATSRRTWRAIAEAAGGNYEYDVAFQSWVGFGHTTTIVVRDGKVVERRLVKFDRNQPQAAELSVAPDGPGGVRQPPAQAADRWTETAEQLGTHAEGAAAKTIDELYDEAATIMAAEPTEDRELRVAYFPNGVLQHCFWIDRRIADDAPRTGPLITALRIAPPAGR